MNKPLLTLDRIQNALKDEDGKYLPEQRQLNRLVMRALLEVWTKSRYTLNPEILERDSAFYFDGEFKIPNGGGKLFIEYVKKDFSEFEKMAKKRFGWPIKLTDQETPEQRQETKKLWVYCVLQVVATIALTAWIHHVNF